LNNPPRIETRLELKNFTGIGAKAVRQDFHATMYLSGLESLLTEAAQTLLDAKATKYPQTVNRAVSFNAIKNLTLALLLTGGLETDLLLAVDGVVPYQSLPGAEPPQPAPKKIVVKEAAELP